ncbi:MAG: adenylosuccinate lyase [Oscillospiraceae bacterium]|nr:adenylosuccinate lyase [Oscillospiraceae bacterium]
MTDRYESPLCKRYAGEKMRHIFSDDNKFSTWRRLWVALAESQRELGLPISRAQIDEMKANITDIDYEAAARFESETNHDVMAHILAYGEKCPLAKPIIHLGATSCYVGDNTDILLMRSALSHIKKLLIDLLERLYDFAQDHKAVSCLAYTHFQAAQPTTLGKRAALWMYDFLLDLEQLDFTLGRLKLAGCKGATGTGASFLSLFENDHEKVVELERKIAAKMGFDETYPVTGQTYPRKIDYYTLSVLSGIAQSAYKFSNDIRLLSHLKEVEEPFKSGQVGSSAMPYKKNPIDSERIASLARFVTVNALNPALTASAQWLERTLDDSANRRIAIPEAFLAADEILTLAANIAGGLRVYPKMIKKHLEDELSFIATENILMHCVKKGGDRQALHERLRVHSANAARKIKEEGEENDLITRIQNDAAFGLTADEIDGLLRFENYTGRAKEQTEEFLSELRAILDTHKNISHTDCSLQTTDYNL